MVCERYREQFTDFLEGTLAEPEWRALEAHLQQCESCTAAIKAFRQAVSALRSLPLVEPPRTLARAISERIAQDAVPAPVVVVKPAARRRWFSWQTAGALAAACVVVAVLAVAGQRAGLVGRPVVSGGSEVSAPAPVPPVGETPAPAAEAAPSGETAAAPSAGPSGPSRPMGTGTAPPGRAARSAGRGRAGTSARAPAASAARAAPPAPGPAATAGVAPPATANADGLAGPAGPAGPAGAAAPLAAEAGTPRAPSVAERVAFGGGVGGAGTARAASGPVSMEIKVDPPGRRQVGEWGPLNIVLKAGGEVPRVTVQVLTDDALQVKNDGWVFAGPLEASRPRRLTTQIRAQQPGTHRLRVVLSSDTPIANTSVDVYLRGYEPAAAAGQTRRQFRSATLAAAVQAVAADCGLKAEVHPSLAGHRVSADFSQGVGGVQALRLLAQMAGGRLESSNSGYRVVP